MVLPTPKVKAIPPAMADPKEQEITTRIKSLAAIGITPSVIIKNPIGTAAFNASFSVFVYLFLVKRKDKPMSNGGTIEPIILTASGPNTTSTNNPSENKDIVLFTGPPKSKLAMPPKIDPITKFELPFIDSSILISEFCNAEIGIPITVSINKPLITVEITGIIITGIKTSMLFGTFIYLLTANTM